MNATAKAIRDDIARWLDLGGPRRIAGSAGERAVHADIAAQWRARGLEPQTEPFATARSLYAVLAVHFGVGLLGSLAVFGSPVVAFVLHLLAAVSYALDSSKRGSLLRRLVRHVQSQNTVAIQPAKTEPRLRVVLIAHADAAFTGWMFRPRLIRSGTGGGYPPRLNPLIKGLRVAVLCLVALGFLDLLIWLGAFSARDSWWLIGLLSLPPGLAAVLNLQVWLYDRAVPGAADNLSGCAALTQLVDRFAAQPAGEAVELVYVISGAEEAGTVGAQELASSRVGRWSTADTVVLAVDTLSGGELRLFLDGEVIPVPPAAWMINVARRVAARVPAAGALKPFHIPSGATDAAPFLYRGYDGIGLGVVDPEIGAPRNYHSVTDDLEHLDPEAVAVAVDVVEAVVREIVRVRISPAAATTT